MTSFMSYAFHTIQFKTPANCSCTFRNMAFICIFFIKTVMEVQPQLIRASHGEALCVCAAISASVMSDVSRLSCFQRNYTEIPGSAVPEDLCHFQSSTTTSNDSLEPPVARQHNASASHHKPRSPQHNGRTPSPPRRPPDPRPAAHQSGSARVSPLAGRTGTGAPLQTCHSPPAIEPRANL